MLGLFYCMKIFYWTVSVDYLSLFILVFWEVWLECSWILSVGHLVDLQTTVLVWPSNFCHGCYFSPRPTYMKHILRPLLTKDYMKRNEKSIRTYWTNVLDSFKCLLIYNLLRQVPRYEYTIHNFPQNNKMSETNILSFCLNKIC